MDLLEENGIECSRFILFKKGREGEREREEERGISLLYLVINISVTQQHVQNSK